MARQATFDSDADAFAGTSAVNSSSAGASSIGNGRIEQYNIYVGQTEVGAGVFAARALPLASWILTFEGPSLPDDHPVTDRDERGTLFQIGTDEYMITPPPDVLVNHSCAPNADIVGDRHLVALQSIDRGEEIRYDYSTTMYDDEWTLDCQCGTPSCRDTVEEFRQLPEDVRRAYLEVGIVPDFIARKYQFGRAGDEAQRIGRAAKRRRLRLVRPLYTFRKRLVRHAARSTTAIHMLEEYKKFAIRGNVIDMAVGIIIGAAFGTVVQSLVKDVLTPPLGLLAGGADFANLFFVLKDGAPEAPYATLQAARDAGAVTINVGAFINALISFLIVSFAVFLLVRYINKLREPDEGPPPPASVKKCPHCVSDIPIQATRCPHCTSELQEAGVEAPHDESALSAEEG